MASTTWTNPGAPAWLADIVDWIKRGMPGGFGSGLYDINTAGDTGVIGGGVAARGEGGVDLGAAPGTPIYALASGPIMAVDLLEQGGSRIGSVISQRVNVPGFGVQDIYYQHLNADTSQFKQCSWGNCGGAYASKGQLLGWTSSIGETEIGFNSTWGNAWGTADVHPASWSTKPEQMIAALMGAGGNTAFPGNVDLTVGQTQTSPTQCAPWDVPCLMSELVSSDIFQRANILALGIVLALIAVILLFIGQGAKHPEAAGTAAKAAMA